MRRPKRSHEQDSVSERPPRAAPPRAAARRDPRLMFDRFPPELLRGLSYQRGVLFVGPGVARSAGLRTRELLADAMGNALRQHVPLVESEDLEGFLTRASHAEIAQALRDQLGSERFLRFLESHLPHEELPPPPLLYALRALPFRYLVTTNVDHLLERTFHSVIEDSTELVTLLAAPGAETPLPEPTPHPVLVKLFGDQDQPGTLVLTTDDYEAFWRLRPNLAQQLQTLLEVGPALFVGYSVHDPEFRRLYSQVGALLARAHRRGYAIMERVNRFEARWWQSRALTVLDTRTDDGLEAAVRELTRQLHRQTHPGADLEAETALTQRSGAIAGWALTPALEAQLERHLADHLLVGAREGLDLRTGFIPLSLVPEAGPGQDRESRIESLLAQATPDSLATLHEPSTVEVHAALEAYPHLLLLGPAGAGKTTLLLHLLRTRTEATLESGRRQIVIYLSVAQLASAQGVSVLECVIEQLRLYVPEDRREDLESVAIDALTDGASLLLIDGLDEVPETSGREVLARLVAFIQDCPRAQLVLTCRTGAFSPGMLPAGLTPSIFEVSPLTLEQSTQFVQDQLHGTPQAAATLTALLRAGVTPWAQKLATNPLHLLLICQLYQKQEQLAGTRASLYESYQNSLLRRRPPGEQNRFYASDKALILEAIAVDSLLKPLEPLTEERVFDLAFREMSRAHITPRKDVSKRAEARDAVREICNASQILTGPSLDRRYAFRHGALREYLVASRLMRDPDAQESALKAHASDPRWAGVWRLMAAIQEDATPLLQRLGQLLPGENRLIIRCFGEARRVRPTWLREMLEHSPQPTQLGRLLSRLHQQLSHLEAIELYGEILWQDHERFVRSGERSDARALFVALSGLTRLIEEEGSTAHQAAESIAGWRGMGEPTPEAPWPCALVRIPAGPFLMSQPDGLGVRLLELPAFELGRDPLTLAQYRAFNPSHPADLSLIAGATEQNLPVTGVSWLNAWVCARWYGARLPTAAEWEKAASWDPDSQVKRLFPWGDEWDASRCNTRETWQGPGQPTPVHRFDGQGNSPYGCRDMSGNVLEWTLDRGTGLLERRVLKGGSFQGSAAVAQPAASVWLRPGYTGPGVGFRLARDAAPQPRDER